MVRREGESLPPAAGEPMAQVYNALQTEPIELTGKPAYLTLAQMIARQAVAAPMAVALVQGARVLNYGTLDAHANQLAQYLRSLGAHPGMPVGVCLERSIDLVVGLL